MNLVELQNISKSFFDDTEPVDILKDVSLKIEQDNVYIIIGFSGSGKTTLLNIITGIEKVDSGKILKDSNIMISYVTQHANFIDELSIDKNLRLVAIKNNNKNKIYELAETFNCSHLLKKKPKNLSGGEKQRINILRGLLLNPNLLILDEPTASLDSDNKHKLVHFINKVQKETKTSIILVTHDMDIIKEFTQKKVFKISEKTLQSID